MSLLKDVANGGIILFSKECHLWIFKVNLVFNFETFQKTSFLLKISCTNYTAKL